MLRLDRLFLSALVDELRRDVLGAVVRRVEADRAASVVVLETSLGEPSRLVVSFSREAPGLYRGEPPGAPTALPTLKSRLVGSRLGDVAISDVDRLVTLTFTRTRLSGRRQGVALVLEVIGARVALFVLDLDTSTVVESFGPGRRRIPTGARYSPPDPPPGAAPLAEDAHELERRLEASDASESLLAASGATPLLVSEIRWIAKHESMSLVDAFGVVRRRLSSPRPTLYRVGGRFVLSPIELESETETGGRSFESFDAAMGETVRLVWEVSAMARGRARLLGAARGARSKLTRLTDKLEREGSRRGEPETLRRCGQLILASLGRARRLRDDAIAVPDVFDEFGRDVEIAIDPRLGLAANAEKYFRRARKQERAHEAVSSRLAEIAAREASLDAFELAVLDAESLAALRELEGDAEDLDLGLAAAPARPAKRAGTRPDAKLGPRKYLTSRGSTVLVGRSSRGNDELTFERAKPDDLWLHASGRAGAHVVLKLEPGREPTEDEVVEAAALAAFYSRGREDTHVEVMVTKRKHVSKLKGAAPGTVKVKEYRTVRVAPRRPGPDGDGSS